MPEDTKIKLWVTENLKPAMFMGSLTPTEINQKLFSNGDTAVVRGIPYDTENNRSGVATIGGNQLEVRNGDVVICENADIFALLQESTEEEISIDSVKDEYGNPIHLPFPVQVTINRLVEDNSTTIYCQVIRKLIESVHKIQ